MGVFITAVIVALGGTSLLLFMYRVSRARRAAEKQRNLADKEKRMMLELELLERLEGIKNPDERAMAKRAIEKDPERAAKVVSNIMKGRGQHGGR